MLVRIPTSVRSLEKGFLYKRAPAAPLAPSLPSCWYCYEPLTYKFNLTSKDFFRYHCLRPPSKTLLSIAHRLYQGQHLRCRLMLFRTTKAVQTLNHTTLQYSILFKPLPRSTTTTTLSSLHMLEVLLPLPKLHKSILRPEQ